MSELVEVVDVTAGLDTTQMEILAQELVREQSAHDPDCHLFFRPMATRAPTAEQVELVRKCLGGTEFIHGSCFRSTQEEFFSLPPDRFAYCEGYLVAKFTPGTCAHAWLLLDDELVVDLTTHGKVREFNFQEFNNYLPENRRPGPSEIAYLIVGDFPADYQYCALVTFPRHRIGAHVATYGGERKSLPVLERLPSTLPAREGVVDEFIELLRDSLFDPKKAQLIGEDPAIYDLLVTNRDAVVRLVDEQAEPASSKDPSARAARLLKKYYDSTPRSVLLDSLGRAPRLGLVLRLYWEQFLEAARLFVPADDSP